jgi:hypothetical protein
VRGAIVSGRASAPRPPLPYLPPQAVPNIPLLSFTASKSARASGTTFTAPPDPEYEGRRRLTAPGRRKGAAKMTFNSQEKASWAVGQVDEKRLGDRGEHQRCLLRPTSDSDSLPTSLKRRKLAPLHQLGLSSSPLAFLAPPSPRLSPLPTSSSCRPPPRRSLPARLLSSDSFPRSE